MEELLLHPHTRSRLNDYLGQPASVLLLAGAPSSGKKYLSLVLASALLGAEEPDLTGKGRLRILPAASSIEDVRALIRELSIKATLSRTVIIHDIDSLSHEAQNALLKTLEQAPISTNFILTTSRPSNVLDTIKSRAVTINVKAVSMEEVKKFYSSIKETDAERAWRISGGLPGLLHALLTENESQLTLSVEDAKKFLNLSPYQRIIFLDKYSKDREELRNFLVSLRRILRAATDSAVRTNNHKNIVRLTQSRSLVMKLQKMLDANSSTKLVALYLINGLRV